MRRLAICSAAMVLVAGAIAYSGTGRGPGYLLLDISTWKPGRYPVVITVDAQGKATAVPLAVTPMDGKPTDPVAPIPNPSSLSQTVATLTKAVTDPAKTQNAAGLSVIYSVIGSKVADGKSTVAAGLAELKKLTDAFLKARGAEAVWKDWRVGVGAALTAERAAGRLATDAQHAAALSTIADSLGSDAKLAARMAKRGGGKVKLKGLIKVLLAIFADGGDFDFGTILKLILGILT